MDESVLSGLAIACLSTSIWRGLWTRKQWTMRAFARANRVLYVDPQESFTYRWKSRAHRGSAPSAGVPAGMTVVAPWPALPFGQDRWMAHGFNTRLLLLQLARHTDLIPPDIWWVYDPAAAAVTARSRARLVVYDCVDRHAAYGGRRGLMDRMEAELLDRADVVFVTARGLVAHCRDRAREVHFVSNGFDEELFAASHPVPLPLERIPRPRLGFIGGLAHWLDVELIVEAATKRPDWSFVLVGPMADVGGVLPEARNIHWVGPCARDDVPAYIGGFDVGMIPFRDTPLTRTVNPLKAYEYLAAGVPVVSTPLPELDGLPVIRQAASAPRFVEAVEEALAEGDSPEARQRRQAAAAPYSLQRGFQLMSRIVSEKLT
ncbi:MAG: glycosyltransferase [Candidatus Eisenbacteria bacterium]|nr:glycosyltransferase [Candidatus Eisenbacteria bacterium]